MRNYRDGASLHDLLADELAAYNLDSARVRLEGPLVHLSADAAQPLAMAFHELATNAAKYGAFADRAGSVEVVWELAQQDDGQLEIECLRLGGIPWKHPHTKGLAPRRSARWSNCNFVVNSLAPGNIQAFTARYRFR